MRRARLECGDDVRHLITKPEEREHGDSLWGEGTKPEARFAVGTLEMERLSVEVVDEEATTHELELGSISQAVFVINEQGVVEDVNPHAEALVGYPREQLIGQRLRFLAHEVMLPSHQVRTFTGCMHHRTGRELTVDVVLCPHRDGSSIAFITPRTAQRQLPQNSEVVQIVHDLKNPLATIALEMCILEDKLVHTELKSAVNRVSQNIAFLDRMVQDLLDASSMEADSFEVHRVPTELRSLIENVIERATATRDRARVFLEAPRPVSLMLDDLRIERVVANLLHNALKYSPSPSGVMIRVDVRTDAVRISVIDAGPGIRPEERQMVFEKFRRASSSHGHEGNGLGLYVSKRIIEAHGGRIGVDSAQGIGACFFFELPLTT